MLLKLPRQKKVRRLPFFLKNDLQLGKKETLEDTARVFGAMFSCIVFRGFEHRTCEILQEESGVPVINALTDLCHPTQALADIMSLEEHFGTQAVYSSDFTISYIGDARNNVAVSLITLCAMLGIHINIAAPQSYAPDSTILDSLKVFTEKSGSCIE